MVGGGYSPHIGKAHIVVDKLLLFLLHLGRIDKACKFQYAPDTCPVLHACPYALGQGFGGVKEREQGRVSLPQEVIGQEVAAKVQHIRIGEQVFPAVRKQAFGEKFPVCPLLKVDSLRNEGIKGGHLPAVVPHKEQKGVVVGVVCRRRLIEQVIEGHIGVRVL